MTTINLVNANVTIHKYEYKVSEIKTKISTKRFVDGGALMLAIDAIKKSNASGGEYNFSARRNKVLREEYSE